MAEERRERPRSALRAFLKSEAGGGLLLMAAAAAALVLANSPFAPAYLALLHHRLGPMSVQHWVNDALMALFFLLVGLEIKREFLDGRLASWERRRLPILAAAAGMAMPALFYLFVASGEPELAAGWAIPAATDIAFAIAVLALLGSRAPTSLKLFLTTVAIADDLGAVVIIALAYTARLDWLALAAAAAILLGLYLLGRRGVRYLPVYLIGGAALWYAVLLSGVHATVAGVLTALVVPLNKTPGTPDAPHSPLHRLEHGLSPFVAYLILPAFGFANAGVALGGGDRLLEPLPLAIVAGLFLGKQAGIFGGVAAAVRFGLAAPLRGATWLQLWGVAMLAGIGFTMSLFIGALAFPNDPALVEEAKLGILAGSLLSAVAGYALLRLAPPHPRHQEEQARLDREIAAGGDSADLEERMP
ncbi:MAG: Na+:H+ antiporter, NhaA family [Sphingomonadales bacterium]|jgi:NhaA family Na+:H+ antiporter|nr:Na+:H+ antiporter, NhaA family [Sphingomonadales bacterium]